MDLPLGSALKKIQHSEEEAFLNGEREFRTID
jgi:hypothetical protein